MSSLPPDKDESREATLRALRIIGAGETPYSNLPLEVIETCKNAADLLAPSHARDTSKPDVEALELDLLEAKRARCPGNGDEPDPVCCQSFEASEQSRPCPPGCCVMAEEKDVRAVLAAIEAEEGEPNPASSTREPSQPEHGLADAWSEARAIDLTANKDAARMVRVGDIMAATLRMMAKENGEMFAALQAAQSNLASATERASEMCGLCGASEKLHLCEVEVCPVRSSDGGGVKA